MALEPNGRRHWCSSSSGIGTILDDVIEGHRLTEAEALNLLTAKGRDVFEIAAAADIIRERKNGDIITYVRNQNLNFTNNCINSCGFCSFCRKTGQPDTFCFNREEIIEKVNQAKNRNVTEICSVGGLHPDFTAENYIEIISLIHHTAPEIHIHANNPMEVWYGAKKSGIPTIEMLEHMKEAGLGSLCGTAAEILVDDVREVICPGKIDTGTWERIIRETHGLGIPTTATIMYGHVETLADRIMHLKLLREIQDDTGGFLEFVPLSFIHNNTPLYLEGRVRPGATGREDILMIAVSRLFLDNFDNIQVSWVKYGKKLAQLGLMAGGNDLGGTIFEESISREAGARDTDFLDPLEMRRMAENTGRKLAQRSTLYQVM
ncbi:5-amino-6-(D-ribitylamino)uracil--L-tyrosine 4-hydroxyphenyl transferase CofH [Methanogenium organophilum]|uniref:5-amino-6-(D-ribitylamino)uracil--L-tyrosine 4-hydroxyphenyl transferase n=1 Tax=Methanogenium organophilum TaxID=2199 RepID=A0A9X9S5Q0_METOG|nr:5-amino-6-(D-ribitylamino)uracil--L-tyrosine 4-hydroxyphenyl transferase CofH [Methanogenium organophilum]WAI02207.1 5-amino-6-(D-ribitylamino)uracil--L-tyrosine 4-hydroxyphenyl transferase CofH [Methanogenium organophilum]